MYITLKEKIIKIASTFFSGLAIIFFCLSVVVYVPWRLLEISYLDLLARNYLPSKLFIDREELIFLSGSFMVSAILFFIGQRNSESLKYVLICVGFFVALLLSDLIL